MNYSLLVTVYNDADYLPRCFDSILSQTYLPDEVIVVNDNSTDKTGAIIDEYNFKNIFSSEPKHEQRWLNRVRAFKLGLSALNTKTSLVLKVDADIIMTSDYASTLIDHFINNKNIAACSGIANMRQFHTLPRNGAIMYRRSAINPNDIREVYAWDRWTLLWLLESGFDVSVDETITYEELRDSVLTLREAYNTGTIRRQEQYPLRGVLIQALIQKGMKKVAFLNGYLNGKGPERHNLDFIRRYSQKEEAERLNYLMKRLGVSQ
ncbi:glycosyltransferase family 2 protein [Candidatus Bathyarchaeota archaeon]|jgi:glycosyltransferase involved in cell wall biosynthesis|nr:glycosyltransferase family 2 protein [Candidatus Bathyarchaeota archaeon]MBT3284630.1 glycosyltransferase family 2 protein [Candidatus Bathyarchaeota archaeon]MBT4321034.1 glycosyltransferase family 2 protein [Candidatus Bathyarchaeota archaeon]MBT4425086.1 glycosyltransferase family 2 protein [Candidatus Bathyarchaeota archaeon]MBT6605863.1 glycosyltransferase family 2 protein [Candidatus Bathyarchaeota archaeon]